MAAAALLRSVASKMSRAAAAAAPTHHHPSLVARGLYGGARSGPAATSWHSNQVQQGTADVLVSAGMAAATGLPSVAGRLTTKMAHAPPPPPYHRLVHGRGIHSRTSPDPIPSTPQKVLHTTALDKATAGVACIAVFGAAAYMHFWLKPVLDEVTAMLKDLREKNSHLINSQNMDASSVSHQTPTAPASGEAPPPPPPPRSEKPSPSPQQQPGGAAATRGKAIPTSPPASFSQLAPAAAPTTPTPPHSGFNKEPFVVAAGLLLFIIVTVMIID